jgi:hypothetical protein
LYCYLCARFWCLLSFLLCSFCSATHIFHTVAPSRPPILAKREERLRLSLAHTPAPPKRALRAPATNPAPSAASKKAGPGGKAPARKGAAILRAAPRPAWPAAAPAPAPAPAAAAVGAVSTAGTSQKDRMAEQTDTSDHRPSASKTHWRQKQDEQSPAPQRASEHASSHPFLSAAAHQSVGPNRSPSPPLLGPAAPVNDEESAVVTASATAEVTNKLAARIALLAQQKFGQRVEVRALACGWMLNVIEQTYLLHLDRPVF